MGAASFALRAAVASLGLFGLLRLPWIELHIVLPLTQAQATVATLVFGRAPSVAVTLACSGTDAIALCLGAILAYPVSWRRRVTGAAGGTAMILLLNTARIGTLGRAAAWPGWFEALHVYVWPAVLTLAIAAYVLMWMRRADVAPERPASTGRLRPSWQFILLSLALLLIFVAASPMYLQSAGLLAVAGVMTQAAAVTLGAIGFDAQATANTLLTSRGGFVVTQECIATPLIPVYLAGVLAIPMSWRWRALGLALAPPVFIALGIARLLVVVAPVAVGSPAFLVHAFFQLLTGILLVIAAAVWRYRNRAAVAHAGAGLLIGGLCMAALGPWTAALIASPAVAPLNDPQGAIAFLPAFQIGLYAALWIAAFLASGWKRFSAGLAALVLLQMVAVWILHSLSMYFGTAAHVPEVRGLAIIGPLVIIAAATTLARPWSPRRWRPDLSVGSSPLSPRR